MDWKHFLRQLLVCTGPWTVYFMQGLSSGFPTVLIPQLRKENHTISDELASWLPAAHTYTGIPWVLILSMFVIIVGRKKSHLIVCTSSLVGFIIFFFSKNMTHFIIGEVFHGALFSAFLTTSVVILTEYTSPKYRGIFLIFKSTSYFWGILIANTLGTFYHWKYIAVLGIMCGIYSLIIVLIWPESPLWLASKGRLRECASAHRWLKGTYDESERELQKLLILHEKNKFIKIHWDIRKTCKTMCRKRFTKPLLLSTILACLYAFSGKLICTVYAIDILKKITSSESTAYSGMLILDCVSLISMYIGGCFCKLYKRRVILIGCSTLGIIFMVIISGYLYIVKLSILNENKYVSIALLAGYSITISIGPVILITSIIAELLPLESRTLTMCAIATVFKFIAGTFIKLSPLFFRHLAMHGTFGLFAVLSIITLILIYVYLPETKDKTLQEIDETLTGKHETKAEETTDLMRLKNKN